MDPSWRRSALVGAAPREILGHALGQPGRQRAGKRAALEQVRQLVDEVDARELRPVAQAGGDDPSFHVAAGADVHGGDTRERRAGIAVTARNAL